MPNSHINTVLLTFPSEREIGETYLERIVPIGTDIAIEQIKPTVKKIRKLLDAKSLKYLE